MTLLNADIQKQLKDIFKELEGPVKFVVFTQGEGGAIECSMCSDTRMLIEEVAALSDKLEVEVLDFVKDAGRAESYQVDKIPAVVIQTGGPQPKDYGIRLYGIPGGYEFSTLIEDILFLSKATPGLSARTLKSLEKLDQPVHIQVYVTPT